MNPSTPCATCADIGKWAGSPKPCPDCGVRFAGKTVLYNPNRHQRRAAARHTKVRRKRAPISRL